MLMQILQTLQTLCGLKSKNIFKTTMYWNDLKFEVLFVHFWISFALESIYFAKNALIK